MLESDRLIIQGLEILQHDKWLSHHAVVVAEGRIEAIIPQHDVLSYQIHNQPLTCWEFPADSYLVPGFIDLHIHGAFGADVMDGTENALQTISMGLVKEGVTGFLATTMTSSLTHIQEVLHNATLCLGTLTHAELLGVHLEGPFIAQDKAGAQAAKYCLPPDIELIKRWQTEFADIIKIVTLAPEMPNSEAFIKVLREMGMVVSIGHTNATYEQTCAAIAAGSQHATHLYNAMRGIHQREPGATGALLLDRAIQSEIIVDGIHLHPAIVKLIYQMKGAKNLLLVTDAIRAKCMGDGHYELGGQDVEVANGKAMLANGTLAGSTLTMSQAIKNIMHFTGCSLSEAILMASTNPARALNLSPYKGTIAKGKDADLVVLNTNLDVEMTLCGGRIVYKKEKAREHIKVQPVGV